MSQQLPNLPTTNSSSPTTPVLPPQANTSGATLSLQPTNVSCNGAADGCITANVSGHSSNLHFLWSTGDTTSTICGLAPGSYTVTVTDTVPATGGLDSLYFETFQGTHNWSLSNSTGTNDATPNAWAVSDDEGGVAPTNCGVANNGDQTLHITCTSSFCGSLITGAVYNATQASNTRAESPAFSTVGYTNITLSFDYIANGDALLDNASLLYNAGAGWQVLTPSLKSALCPTGQGLWTAFSITLPAACENNPSVQLGFNWTNNADNIGTDPSVALNNILVTSLGTGTGSQICTFIADTTISQPNTLIAAADSISPVVCVGSNNGFIDLGVSGGTIPYSYLWSTGATTQDVFNLVDSSYTVTVTDANGCTAVDSFVVTTIGFIDIAVDSVNMIACNGGTGAIYTTATGDTTQTGCFSSTVVLNEIMYRPVLQNGQSPNTGEYIELLGPPGADISCYVLTDGDWTLTIPQGTTIPSDGIFTIGNDVVWGAGTFDLDAENCNCFTDGNGGFGLLILTDGGEYVALFDDLGTFLQGVIYGNPSAANTPSGNTIVTAGVTGCVTTVTIPNAGAFETAPGSLGNGTSLARNPDGSGTWVGQPNGSLNTCNFSGLPTNNGTVSYLWNNGDTTQDISNLAAGIYTVTATDTFGCTATTTYNLTEPDSLEITTTALMNAACLGDSSGNIDITVLGGTMPYSFAWSNGDTTEDLNQVVAGIYCVTLTDANGCMTTHCDTITEPTFSVPVDSFSICAGDSVQLEVLTNASIVQWLPSTGLDNPNSTNPIARPTGNITYIVRASMDSSICWMVDSVTITTGGLNLSLASSTNIACNGDSTGSITTSITGSGFSYIWNTGDTTANLSNLPAGSYQVTVSDGSLCQDTLSVILSEPTPLQVSATTLNNVTCNTGTDGQAAVSAQGGTGPYSYNWLPSAITTDTINNLSAGVFTVIVTDNNNCQATSSVSITEPSAIVLPFSATDVSCGGSNDGFITVQPTGGTPGYTYQWDAAANNQTTSTASNLGLGTYSVTVTDTVGCTEIANGIFVGNSLPIDSADAPLDIINGNLSCDGMPTGALTIATSNTYTYLWSNGATTAGIDSLAAGSYSVTVSNTQGCSLVWSTIITQPFIPSINPFINTPNLISATEDVGTTVTISGGNDQSSLGALYNWTEASNTINFDNATAHTTTATSTTSGTYVLFLTATANDSTACTDTASVVLRLSPIFEGVPNAFTPNGDGINDIFAPVELSTNEIIRFRVYNRWGQEVYRGDDLEDGGWDGRFMGVAQDAETYIYVLEFDLGDGRGVQTRRGQLTLIR